MIEDPMAQPDEFRSLVESMPAGMVHLRNGTIAYCNETFAAMVRELPAQLLGRPFLALVAPQHRELARERYLERQAGGGAPGTWELELLRAGNQALRVQIMPRALAPGEHLILLRDIGGTLHDIDLANRLSALALRLQRERSLEAVLRITREGMLEFGLRMHALRLESDALVLQACTLPIGDPVGDAIVRRFSLPSDSYRFPLPDEALSRRLFEEGQSVYLDDVQEALRSLLNAKAGNEDALSLAGTAVQKGVLAPLFVNDRPWGAIFVGSDFLSARDAATIALFAAQVASAMEVARQFDELARANRGLRAIHEVARAGAEHELARILPRLLEVAAGTAASERAVIYLHDAESGELLLAGSHGPPSSTFGSFGTASLRSGIFAQAIELQRPLAIRGIAPGDDGAALVAPLQVQGRLCGMLCLGRLGNIPFDDDEAHAIEPVAAQLAIQIENARLYSQTRRRLELLSVQYALSRTIAGKLEEVPLVEEALALLAARLGADAGWIYVRKEQRLVRIDRPRNEADTGPLDLPLDDSTVCGRCALERRTLVIDLEDQASEPSPAARGLGIRHLLAIPLEVDDQLIGTLCVGRKGPQGFRNEERQLLESTAIQLAVALERVRLFAEERRRVSDLSRINELGGVIAQHLDLPALLSVGVEHLVRLVDTTHVFLALTDPEGGPMRVVASNLREPGVFDIVLPLEENSAAAEAVREMRPVLIDDALQDPRTCSTLALRFGHRTLLAIPLISRGESIGAVILADTREGHRYIGPAIERAVAMANQLAAAIANARLFEEERRRVRELSLLSELGRIASGTLQREVLLAESLGHISGALHFGAGAAWIVQRGRLEPATSQFGDPAITAALEAPAERALAAGAPISAEGPGGSFLCALPLLAGAEVGGVLAFARQGKPLADSELRTLAAGAPELGMALQNATLFDGARRRAEELRLLLDIGRAITGSLDLDQILETSATALSRIIDGSNGFVLLLDAASSELRGVACSNPAWRDTFRQARIPLDSPGIVARAMRTRAPVVVDDLGASEFHESERARLYGEKSVLALPLLVRDEPIGCIVVDDTRQTREWTAAEIERATLIAHQLAVAVANARLYDDLKRSYGELARTQEELVKRERLAALGELSAVVAHEVRNPLGVIFNSLGSMRKLLRPTGDGAMLMDIVEEEADRLDRIVRDLLDFARPHEPALESERLDALLDETLKAVRADRVPEGVRVEMALPGDLPLLRIDERMIRQVLLNLVINGMQAMPRGGTLQIRATLERQGRPMIRIDFTDEGTGVPPELAARIFQPFFTTKAAGTGLGLAVVKRFVEAHRGTINFHSRQGEGTTFTLVLPVDEAAWK